MAHGLLFVFPPWILHEAGEYIQTALRFLGNKLVISLVDISFYQLQL